MDLSIYNDSYDCFCDSILDTNGSILEIGCGPGNITKYIKTKLPNISILATDVSENMIELATKNVKGVDFKVLDARNINEVENRLMVSYVDLLCPIYRKMNSQNYLSIAIAF